jgi:hypothetical protein
VAFSLLKVRSSQVDDGFACRGAEKEATRCRRESEEVSSCVSTFGAPHADCSQVGRLTDMTAVIAARQGRVSVWSQWPADVNDALSAIWTADLRSACPNLPLNADLVLITG